MRMFPRNKGLEYNLKETTVCVSGRTDQNGHLEHIPVNFQDLYDKKKSMSPYFFKNGWDRGRESRLCRRMTTNNYRKNRVSTCLQRNTLQITY